MRRRRRWAPCAIAAVLAAVAFDWLWDHERPWVVMFAPSRAARLLTEYDHRILFGRSTAGAHHNQPWT